MDVNLLFQRHVFVFILSISFAVFSSAKEVVIGFGKNKAPFVIQEAGQGLEIDIFREALAYKGHTLSIVHVDNKGLLPALISGRVEGIATARDSQKRFCEVNEFIEFDNVAISLKDRKLKINKVNDLKAYTLVAWEKAYQDLGLEYNLLFRPDALDLLPIGYFENRNQEAQNAMFWAGRTDLIVVDKTIFSWYRRQLSSQYPTDQLVVYHKLFGEKTYFPALFNDTALCEDFRAGLEKLKKENRYQQLFEKYTN
jgi:polar amino acid transport system substrate-binding protein